ncbi:hypothetical protein AAFG13_20025 [Bradyrhizobium sp. B124]|uniref:hypothetical protein n=1 Tax=Bradyrhizobium sp. B124 TaxID=3140245 RepID=UPI00318428EA
MTDDSPPRPQITAGDAAELRRARDRMIARDKVIDEMVDNNERQITNEHARGGAEIELACAVRGACRSRARGACGVGAGDRTPGAAPGGGSAPGGRA